MLYFRSKLVGSVHQSYGFLGILLQVIYFICVFAGIEDEFVVRFPVSEQVFGPWCKEIDTRTSVRTKKAPALPFGWEGYMEQVQNRGSYIDQPAYLLVCFAPEKARVNQQ